MDTAPGMGVVDPVLEGREGGVAAFAPLQAGDPEQIGRYRIVGRLGRGGMGQVYLGLSPSGRAVAVKVVRAALADDPGFRRRFAREVKAARRVTGFFTAAVVDADPEGTPPWLTTTYVPGMALDAAVAAYGAWPKRSVLALGAALAEALDAVHRTDLVHRDLKPSNVLLAADGPRVIDFGISLAAETTKLTETGVVIGTPGFISPEQLVDNKVSAASDVFALGAVLAYAATGTGPFGTGNAHALNYRVVHKEPDLTGLPTPLADVVARCLAKDPDQRPTVPRLVDELGRASETGRADGFFTEADWLPEPVAAAISRVQATPLPAPPADEATAEAALADTATAPSPDSPAAQPPPPGPTPGGGRLRPARRRILTGLAVTAVLALVWATAIVVNRLSAEDRPSGARPNKAADGPPARKELWSRPLGDGMTLAAVADGRVYVSNDKDRLRALDADSGDELWSRRGTGDSLIPLGASDGMAYYGDEHAMYALDAGSGDERWKDDDDGYHAAIPTAADGTTYMAHFSIGILIAVKSDTGDEIWRKRYSAAWQDNATIADGSVYLASADEDGALYAVDTKSGDQRWKFTAGNLIESSTVVVDGTVYFGSQDGTLYAVDSDSGREVWRRGFDGTLWDPAVAGGAGDPMVADGVVYFENDGYVCAFTAATGKPLWRHKPGLDEVELLSVADGTVLFRDHGDEGRTLYALDADSGKRLWEENLGENLTMADGTLYYEDGGRLHAVSAAAE